VSVKPTGRLFKLVAANSSEVLDHVPANLELLQVDTCYGQAGNSPDTVVAIIWDEVGANVVLYCTHQSGNDGLVDFSVVGDGVKKLTIKLVNTSNVPVFLGAGWAS